MAAVVSCVNLKGGVGKTALAVNFAAYCGRRGLRTLLLDVDAQTNATFSCMPPDEWQKHAAEHGTVADLLEIRGHTTAEGRRREAKGVIKRNVFENVDLVPSHLDLITIDLDLASRPARETRLRKALQPVADGYDVMVCDCPPNLALATQNALALSTHYVVPISPDFLSGIGIGLLLSRVKEFADDLGHYPEHVGIVISRVGRPALDREENAAALRKKFGEKVFPGEIKERVAVSESASKQKPVYDMGDRSATQEFTAVSQELLKRMGINK